MTVLHGYRVLRLLGEGGFGKTWLVEQDERPGERLVLKRLHLSWRGNPKAQELFQREVDVLRRLRHGGLPRVVDSFTDDEGLALVQTFVEGTDLEKLLAGGRRFDEDEVADLVARTLEVLDYLHTVQPPVVHRDIKPGNLILGEDGHLTLIDLGAVKEIAAAPGGGTTIIQSEGYSPTEQLMGQVGPASDLYALGATGLHLLTGVAPAELFDVQSMRLRWSHRVQCSAGLAELLDRLTEPFPANRFPTARVALEAVRSFRAGSRRTPSPPLDPKGPFGDGKAVLMPGNLKSREDVPAAIRRAARFLEGGLDGTCTVWYEPLFDPSGEKPHLAVLVPDRGIAVMEVLDVTRPKLLGFLPQGLRIRLAGKEVEVPSPLLRAERLAEALRQRQPGVPVVALAVFPGMERKQAGELGRVLDLGRCLFREDLEEGRPAMLRAMGNPPAIPADDETEKRLRGLMQPQVVLPTSLFLPEADDDVLVVMDRRQEALARDLGGGHRVVRGVAGSGKTMVLVFRARMLSELFPQRRFVVTCYTRSLAGQLRDILSGCPNVHVAHLDQLMAGAIRQAGVRHPGYDDDDGDRVARVALEAQALGRGERFDGVLLDEAQDFGTASLQFAVGLLKPDRDDLLVVADAAQNIFRRRFSWKQAGIRAQGRRTRILRTNYRNTREILQFAFDYLVDGGGVQQGEAPDPEDEHTVIPPEAACRSGPEPLLIERSSDAERVEAAAERAAVWARRPNAAMRSIGVLYPSSRTAGSALAMRLRALGVAHFWLADPSNKKNRDHLAMAREPVVLTTIHSAKGLEFDQVVVCGLEHPDFEPRESRKLAYVAMTRAREELVVVR